MTNVKQVPRVASKEILEAIRNVVEWASEDMEERKFFWGELGPESRAKLKCSIYPDAWLLERWLDGQPHDLEILREEAIAYNEEEAHRERLWREFEREYTRVCKRVQFYEKAAGTKRFDVAKFGRVFRKYLKLLNELPCCEVVKGIDSRPLHELVEENLSENLVPKKKQIVAACRYLKSVA